MFGVGIQTKNVTFQEYYSKYNSVKNSLTVENTWLQNKIITIKLFQNIHYGSTLSEELQNQLEGDLTREEVKSSKNNISPGPDGYPVEFYKHFWSYFGPFLLRALNYSFSKKS